MRKFHEESMSKIRVVLQQRGNRRHLKEKEEVVETSQKKHMIHLGQEIENRIGEAETEIIETEIALRKDFKHLESKLMK